MSRTPSRSSAVDPLRLVLALSVIALHTGFPDGLHPLAKQVLVNGLYRLAVPVFAVVSGYFFLSALQSGRGRRYLGRILMLYGLWMLIYLPIYGPGQTSTAGMARLWFFGYFQLWFLPGLMVSAVTVMGLARLGARGGVIIGLAIACAIIGLGLQYLVVSGRGQVLLDWYRNGLFVIFPYFASGYLLATFRHRTPGRGTVLTVAALSLVAVMAESLIWYRIAGGGFGIDNMASLLIAAPAVFVAALQRQGISDGKRIASMAAFVYFVHVLMMVTASRMGLSGNPKALFVMGSSVATACLLGTVGQGRILRLLT